MSQDYVTVQYLPNPHNCQYDQQPCHPNQRSCLTQKLRPDGKEPLDLYRCPRCTEGQKTEAKPHE